MFFDLEDKIRWESLAPSLQAMFDFKDKFNIMLTRFIHSGEDGQDLKINTKTGDLFADDNFKKIKTSESDAELNKMKNIPLSDLSLISDWEEVRTLVSNSSYDPMTNFSYNPTSRYIDILSPVQHALISSTNLSFQNTATLMLKVINTNNSGYIGVIVSSLKIGSEIHDISVTYDGSKINIVFDEFSSTNNKMVLDTYVTDSTATWSTVPNSYCFIKVRKEYGYIHVWASKLNSNIFDYEFIYNLPYTPPSGANTKQFSLLLRLLRNDAFRPYIGIGNNNFLGKVLFLYGLTDEDDLIYDLKDIKVHYYENGIWNKFNNIDDALLPKRSFIYNPYLNKLYWYKFASTYYPLNVPESTIPFPTTLTGYDDGYLTKVNKDGTIFLDSNFRTLKFSTNQTEKNTMMSYGTAVDSRYDNQDLYCLNENRVYTYSATTGWTYKDTVMNLLPNYIHIYNPFLKIFYFYENAASYTKIIAR